MAKNKLTVNINEAVEILRNAGIPMTAARLADGIESGVYPFGRLVRKSETTGQRFFEIFRIDVLRFIDEKTPKEAAV